MPWLQSAAAIEGAVRSPKFLIDESLSPSVMRAVSDLGYDATYVFTNQLDDQRILLTRNRELFEHDTLCVCAVLLPDHIDVALLEAVAHALSTLWSNPNRNECLRIVVHNDGRFTVLGTLEKSHYKLRKTGPPLIWIAKNEHSPSSVQIHELHIS